MGNCRRGIAAGLATSLLCGCAGIGTPGAGRAVYRAMQRGAEAAAREAMKSVVVVAIEGEAGGVATGGSEAARSGGSQILTGVVVSPDGYILVPGRFRSNHAGRIEVRIGADAFPARPIQSSETLAWTVLKIRPREPLAPLRLSPTADLAPGEWAVVAVPSDVPDAEERYLFLVLSRGVLPGHYRRFLVSSMPRAALGAPVLNMDGDLVGWLDISGVLSANDVREELNLLLARARQGADAQAPATGRGWIGLFIEPVNRDLARQRQWPPAAVWITHVARGGPAEKAGLKVGDLVVEVNGRPFPFSGNRAVEYFLQALAARPGKKFSFRVLRDGRPMDVAGMFAKPPEPDMLQAEDLGITVQTLTDIDVFQRTLFVKTGVLVTAVEKGSPAATSSAVGRGLLMVGDVILELDGRPTPNVKEFQRVLNDLRRRRPDVVLLKLVRGRMTDFEALNLTIGKAGRTVP